MFQSSPFTTQELYFTRAIIILSSEINKLHRNKLHIPFFVSKLFDILKVCIIRYDNQMYNQTNEFNLTISSRKRITKVL